MKTTDHSIAPAGNDNFTKAEFRLWIPSDVTKLEGVLCPLPGFNGDGRKMADDPLWQDFARDMRMALMTGHFVAVLPAGVIRQHLDRHYTHVCNGSGRAFWEALGKMAGGAGMPDLARLPVAFWGHSAGGQFGYSMACYYPERVIGFVSIKGGFYYSQPSERMLRDVPGLFIAGEKDEPFRVEAIQRVFEHGRSRGALWCRATERGAGHGIEHSNKLALPFLRAVIRRKGKSDAGWLGDLRTGEICPAEQFAGDPLQMVWLPDGEVADRWRAMMIPIET